MPDVPLVIVESPYRALVGPMLAYLDVLDRAVAAGQAGADHVRRHPRVRRPQLVGADPLQPVGRTGCARPSSGGRTRSSSTCPYRREEDEPASTRHRCLTVRRRRSVESNPRAASATRARGGIGTAVPDIHQAAVSARGPRAQRRPERRRIVRLACQAARSSTRPSWSPSTSSRSTGAAARADVAGRSEDAQRVLDPAEGIAETEHHGSSDRPAPGARGRGGARRRGERAGADLLSWGCPTASASVAISRSGARSRMCSRTRRARSGWSASRSARSQRESIVIVGCGRVGAMLAAMLDDGGHRSTILDIVDRAPSTACRARSGAGPARRRHRRGHPPARRPRTPTCSWR